MKGEKGLIGPCGKKGLDGKPGIEGFKGSKGDPSPVGIGPKGFPGDKVPIFLSCFVISSGIFPVFTKSEKLNSFCIESAFVKIADSVLF